MTDAATSGDSSLQSTSPRLAYVVTHPMTVEYLLESQLVFLTGQGYEVLVLAGPGAELDSRVAYRPIPSLNREIRLLRDLRALFEILATLRRLRPAIINASTPKAGLLGLIAGVLARVPHRIYTLRGLRLETTRGLRRALLSLTEKIAVASAHRVVAVSESLRDRALELDLVAPDKIEVLGSGSSNGVDTDKFRSEPSSSESGLRRALGVSEQSMVIGFIGRLTHDKGIGDLLAAFEEHVRSRVPSARLLIVGGFEEGDPLGRALQEELARNPAAVLTGFVKEAAPYYRLMDVLAFPSYREGFPNAPLEAAASEVPVAGYAATGTVDAVIDGNTGTLVPTGDVEALGRAICSYLLDPHLRSRHGKAGRQRVLAHFQSEVVWKKWSDFYQRELRR